jgi:predicted Zn-dependent peptidase
MIRFVLTLLLLAATLPARAGVEIAEITTPGGFDAWLVEDHSIPFVALEVRFRGGASLDAPDARGATNLMVALLEEGAGERDARAFTQATEELAARFGYGVSDDAVSISARFLTENRAASVDLLRDSLIAPRFDEDAIERVRAQVLAGLRSDETNPRDIARRRASSTAHIPTAPSRRARPRAWPPSPAKIFWRRIGRRWRATGSISALSATSPPRNWARSSITCWAICPRPAHRCRRARI